MNNISIKYKIQLWLRSKMYVWSIENSCIRFDVTFKILLIILIYIIIIS